MSRWIRWMRTHGGRIRFIAARSSVAVAVSYGW